MDAIDVGWRTALLFALSLPTALAALLIGWRASDRPAFVWLALLLGAWSWHSIPYIIGFAGAYDTFPWLTFAPFNMELWFGPLLYLHARALARNDGLPRLWLLMPGCVQFVYYALCFVLLGDGPAKFAFNRAFHMPYVVPVETFVGLTLATGGMVLAWRETRNYQGWLKRSHAAADAFDPVWLRRFVIAMGIAVGAWIGFDLWAALVGDLNYVEVFWLYLLIGIVFLMLALSGLTNVDVVFPKIRVPEPVVGSRPDAGISIDDIAARVRAQRLYEYSDLSLASLSRHIGTNENYLSRVINSEAGVNFNRFINQIRVEAVCERLANPASEQNLLRVAMDSGFASKATFNRVFRDITGSSPGNWRKRALERLKSPKSR